MYGVTQSWKKNVLTSHKKTQENLKCILLSKKVSLREFQVYSGRGKT
jgi:hypothetical protein